MLNLTNAEKRGVKLAFRELYENRRDVLQDLLKVTDCGTCALCPHEVGIMKSECNAEKSCVICWKKALHLKEDDQEGYV